MEAQAGDSVEEEAEEEVEAMEEETEEARGGEVGSAEGCETNAHVTSYPGDGEEALRVARGEEAGAHGDVVRGGTANSEVRGDRGGDGVTVVDKPWVPKDIQELLDAIATADYGVSDDPSAKLTLPALKAYNAAVETYTANEKTALKRGETLPESFKIVKVCVEV